jgi:hypothetical protein
VANDTVDKMLYLNQSTPGHLKFVECGSISGCALDDRGAANGSMGLDAGDPFRTGAPSLWVTNYENELHALYEYQGKPGKPFFAFRSSSSGIGALGRKYVGWGTAFVDADLDGWEDLFIAHGHAIRYPTGKEEARKQYPVLLLNEKGRFRSVPGGIGEYGRTTHLSRGMAMGDLDNDGRADFVICHTNERVAILRGIGGADRHWLGVELAGTDHACIVGAKVTFEPSGGGKQTRFAKGGGSYLSSSDRRMLFGLGSDRTGRLIVEWPGGQKQTFEGVAADRYYRIDPKSSSPTPLPVPKK